MSRTFRSLTALCLSVALLTTATHHISAQQPNAKKKVVTATTKESKTEPEVPDHVVIEREALRLIDPKVFHVPLQLKPIRDVQLTALTDGIVTSVKLKPGQKVDSQTEALQLENREDQLMLDYASAQYKVAQIERKLADSANSELAEAKLEAAKAQLDLARFRLDRNKVHAPFAGQVLRIYVVEGQFVRAGEPLLRFGDTSRLQVEIPVDRTQASEGAAVEIRIEDKTEPAKIERILPLAPEFEPLRELVNSAASAVVYIDNPGDRFQVGQAVFAPLVPRHQVAEVPTGSLIAQGDGAGKVQVLRESVVREVAVQLHGQVGTDRIFVSGPFAEGDEVITKSSFPLPDGTQIRLSSAVETTPEGGQTPSGRRPVPRQSFGNF